MDLTVNWVSVPIFLVLGTAVALYAASVSGGWLRPWLGLKPVWWLALLVFVPFIGLPRPRRAAAGPPEVAGSDHRPPRRRLTARRPGHRGRPRAVSSSGGPPRASR